MRARVLGILFAIGAIATPTHAQDTAGGRVSVLGSATRVAAPVAATPVPQQNLPPSVPPAFADPEGTEQPGSVSAVPATVHAEGASTLAVIDGPPPLIAPDIIARDEAGRATIRAIKLAQGIRLDGQLDEQVYESVPPVTDFIQQLPDEGAPGTERTEAWIMFEPDQHVCRFPSASVPPSEWLANEMRQDTVQRSQILILVSRQWAAKLAGMRVAPDRFPDAAQDSLPSRVLLCPRTSGTVR